MPLSDADEEGLAAVDDSFSSLVTPDLQQQNEMHDKQTRKLASASVDDLRPPRRRRKTAPETDIGFVFHHVFKKDKFRGKQKDIMQAAVNNLDVVVIAPTGMGKSLCFQVPALAERHGITIVISPLISLMEDQVQKLTSLKLPAALLNSNLPHDETRKILDDLKAGHPKTRLLYVTPERIVQPEFLKKLAIVYKQNELARFVVDEMHCIDQWASFRGSYKQLGVMRDHFPNVPIMALTASATDEMIQRIVEKLQMDRQHLFIATHSVNRPNIFYQVVDMKDQDAKLAHMLDYIRKEEARPGPRADGKPQVVTGIVYCRLRVQCDTIAEYLRSKGIAAQPHHRGQSKDLTSSISDMWMQNEALAAQGKPYVSCVVATISLGMGIDRANCRYVIHFNLPTSFEGYYQETGRAGRDQRASRTLLYYSDLDAKDIVNKSRSSSTGELNLAQLQPKEKSSAKQLVAFCKDKETCRHVAICNYFGEEVPKEEYSLYCERFCDNCKRLKAKSPDRRDIPIAMEVEPVVAGPSRIATEARSPNNLDLMFDDDDTDDASHLANAVEEVEVKPGILQEKSPNVKKRKLVIPDDDDDEADVKPMQRLKALAADPMTSNCKDRPLPPFKKHKPVASAKDKGKQRAVQPEVLQQRKERMSETPPLATRSDEEGDEISSQEMSPSSKRIHIDPSPGKYHKDIDSHYRTKAVLNLYNRLCKAALRDAEVDFGGTGLTLLQKKTTLMASANELESDLFWASVTMDGYKDRLKEKKEEITEGLKEHKKLVGTLKRAVKRMASNRA